MPCVQPTANQRRRRFAERELLSRIRHYEDILQQNNISFQPLHGSATSADTPNDYDDAHHDTRNEVISVWRTIKRVALEDDDNGDESDTSSSSSSHYENVDKSVQEAILANDHLLFGAPNPEFNLTASHPGQAQIFKLWQIYLDNINPLLNHQHTHLAATHHRRRWRYPKYQSCIRSPDA